MASHFCIGHVLDMRLIDLYLYIFFDAHGCPFVVSLCESFYYAVECKCLCDVLLHYVCIFRHSMHDVMVVCFLYAVVDVPI